MKRDLFTEYPQGGIPRSEGAAAVPRGHEGQSTRSASTESSPPTSCGTCTAGKHMESHGRRLGWVACALIDSSKFFPETRSCVNGRYVQVQEASPVPAAPKPSTSINTEVEIEAWWKATGG